VSAIHDPALLGPKPLSDHALSHVMSDILSADWVETDDDEVSQALAESGYRPNEIEQVMHSWRAHWRAVTTCSTCGHPATHMWASLSEEGVPTSMAGPWRFSPACDECTGEAFDDGAGRPVIRATLDTPTAIPRPPGEYVIGPELAVNKATLDGIEATLNEFDAETLDNQQHLDEAMSRPLLNRVADHVAYTISLQRKIVAAKEAVR
jgi:hypothetical protein